MPDHTQIVQAYEAAFARLPRLKLVLLTQVSHRHGLVLPVAEIAEQLGNTAQTVYNWRNQDQVDRGVRTGVSTRESAELTAAKKRIGELETELAITRRANELLKAQADPKGGGRSSRRS